MTAMAIEDLTDEVALQDLDYSPPCELQGVHVARRAPIGPADLAITTRPPCGCEEAQISLACKECDQWLAEHIAIAGCEVCGKHFSWAQEVVSRVPL